MTILGKRRAPRDHTTLSVHNTYIMSPRWKWLQANAEGKEKKLRHLEHDNQDFSNHCRQDGTLRSCADQYFVLDKSHFLCTHEALPYPPRLPKSPSLFGSGSEIQTNTRPSCCLCFPYRPHTFACSCSIKCVLLCAVLWCPIPAVSLWGFNCTGTLIIW